MGNNMFVHCNNNPVNFADPSGMYISCRVTWQCFSDGGSGPLPASRTSEESDFLEWFLLHMARPREEGNTFSVGLSGGYSSAGFAAGKSVVLSADTSFNYAIQETTSTGVAPGIGGSGGMVMTYTNATDVQDLTGASISYGATIVPLTGLSVDYITFNPPSDPNTTCWGISVVISLGGEFDVHGAENYTTSTSSWNPFIALWNLLYGG